MTTWKATQPVAPGETALAHQTYRGQLLAHADGGYPVIYQDREAMQFCNRCAISQDIDTLVVLDGFERGERCDNCGREIR